MIEAKDIIGYEGLYQIQSNGYVVALPRIRHYRFGHTKLIGKRLIRPIANVGYPSAMLRGHDNKQRAFPMHRLMAIYFIPNDDPLIKREINHKNKDITDYRIKNLEWCTRQFNCLHAKKKRRCTKVA